MSALESWLLRERSQGGAGPLMSLTCEALIWGYLKRQICVRRGTMSYLWTALKKNIEFECLPQTTWEKIPFSKQGCTELDREVIPVGVQFAFWEVHPQHVLFSWWQSPHTPQTSVLPSGFHSVLFGKLHRLKHWLEENKNQKTTKTHQCRLWLLLSYKDTYMYCGASWGTLRWGALWAMWSVTSTGASGVCLVTVD